MCLGYTLAMPWNRCLNLFEPASTSQPLQTLYPSMIQMPEVLPPSTCSCLLWWPGRQHQHAVFSKRKAPKEKMKAHATGNKKLLLSLEASIDLFSKKDASLSPRPHNLDQPPDPPDVQLSATTPKLLMTTQLGYSLAKGENPKHCLIMPIMEK